MGAMNGINTIDSPPAVLDLIYRMKVKDVMTSVLVTATEDATLRSIQNLMRERGITGVPIVRGSHLLGLVSVEDIILALDKGFIEDRAGSRMTTGLIVLEEDMPVSFALRYFDKFRYHRFPVLNSRKELVGIVTNRDISAKLFVEISKEIDRLERRSSQADSSDVCLLDQVMSFAIRKRDFESAGCASTQIKKHLKKAGMEPRLIRRAAVASYELEMNIVVHSEGGELIAEFSPDRVTITAKDWGPGIKDTALAMRKGWTTADEWIRSLGFGAGMGLPNVKSVSDEFHIAAGPSGTLAVSTIYLNKSAKQEESDESR